MRRKFQSPNKFSSFNLHLIAFPFKTQQENFFNSIFLMENEENHTERFWVVDRKIKKDFRPILDGNNKGTLKISVEKISWGQPEEKFFFPILSWCAGFPEFHENFQLQNCERKSLKINFHFKGFLIGKMFERRVRKISV